MILIDGYNLLHALGMAPRPGGFSLERARLRFVEWLAVESGSKVGDLCVIFDGRTSKQEKDQVHRGVRMRFSAGEKADDLIERLIRDEPAPVSLTVVSNDGRIIQAAKRRGCGSLSCGEFVDSLQSSRRPEVTPAAVEPEKPEAGTDDLDEWLQAFEIKERKEPRTK